ncbi:MAG: PSD1 and planctomycete cytochrome C domain-containing protein [Bryobacteraceae bacterium]|nr:PSD1 and planctomycete cytochrome C domain-containing protein [Bryobacteraceae bacterium]
MTWTALLLLAADPVDFARDVQPIFARSCAGCHGPKAQLGSLRLDSREAAAKAIHAGAAVESSLYQRVAGIGDQARMPMGAKPLPPEEIATIKRWIDEGATWPESLSAKAEIKKHWAFVAPVRPELPSANAPRPIDKFVLARLEKEGMRFSPEADRITLLRRVHLDLIGLPPTVEEVDAYLADKSPRAYERAVDRLLASPHYGERWARHWLDAARYADSDGYEKDKQRSVWFYRDWVINAFNRDLPYNQFLIEQLAGDLLPNATQDQKVATGFLRNSMINEEGGIDPEQFRMEAMFDRMDAMGKSMLGITIQCAQCHNHKYDPLTQEEYYKLFAFLNNSHESNAAVYTPAEQQKRAQIFQRIREIEQDLQHKTPDWQTRMAAWEAQIQAKQPKWEVTTPDIDDIATGGQKYAQMKDGSVVAGGYAPTRFSPKFTLRPKTRNVRAVRLEMLNDPNLPMNGPGRSVWGTAALTEFEVKAMPAGVKDAKPVKVKIASATADVNPPETQIADMYWDKTNRRRVTGPVEFAIDGIDETAWGTDNGPGRRNQPRQAVFVFADPVDFPEGVVLEVSLTQRHGGWNSDDNMNHNLGRFRLSVTDAPDAAADPRPATNVFSVWRTTVPEWRMANEAIEQLWREHPQGTTQLVMNEREEMRETHLLMRGDFLKPGKSVQPGTPAFLNPAPADGPVNRLTLAKWMTDRQSPTVARSIVNRIWQSYFGTGIVATSEDLGKQAETPSHPELLDWLAVDLMDNGWSLKKLHKAIVMSNTYRQSSKVSAELYAKDPYNRLLARGSRFRVDAELVRDIALAASGLLNPKVGGPSVYPPAPEFLFQPPVSYGPKNWFEEKGPNRYRRGLYTFRFRSVPYPMLQAFDAPNGDMSCVRRGRSNTPLQALTTLNEPLFLETARALALKTVREGGTTDRDRLRFAFRRVVSRVPSDKEADLMLTLLAKQTAKNAANAWELAADDPKNPPALPNGVTPQQLAGWTTVSRVLLNLDEAITKE